MEFKSSAELDKLFGALSKAQSEIAGASKKSKNPLYNSKYADLSEVIDVSREPLAKNGLSVIQMPGDININDTIVSIKIETVLAHESGQWMSSVLFIPMYDRALVASAKLDPQKAGAAIKLDPQKAGAAITYGRRYAYAAILRIYQEDDDGNFASDKQKSNDIKKTRVLKNELIERMPLNDLKNHFLIIEQIDEDGFDANVKKYLDGVRGKINNSDYEDIRNHALHVRQFNIDIKSKMEPVDI